MKEYLMGHGLSEGRAIQFLGLLDMIEPQQYDFGPIAKAFERVKQLRFSPFDEEKKKVQLLQK
jgi:hypothetical protein